MKNVDLRKEQIMPLFNINIEILIEPHKAEVQDFRLVLLAIPIGRDEYDLCRCYPQPEDGS